jgi:hypothetical protein
VSLVLATLFGTILAGLLTFAVSRAVIGQRTTVADAWSGTKARIAPLIGVTLVTNLVVFGTFALLTAGVIAGAFAVGGGVGIAIGLFGVLGAALLAIWLWIKLVLTAPILVLEGQGVFASIKRSWALSARTWWRLFGIQLLTALIVGTATMIIQLPFTIIGAALFPDSAMGALVFIAIAGAISTTLAAPFNAGVTALLYIDVRIRREGLDLALARAAAE